MLCIHGLSGTQEKDRPDRSGTAEAGEKQERPEHKLITGVFFLLLGVALLIGVQLHFVEPDLTSELRLSGLLTTAAGIGLVVAYAIDKKVRISA